MQGEEEKQQRLSSSQEHRHQLNEQRRERHGRPNSDRNRDRERDRVRGDDRERERDREIHSSSPQFSRRRQEYPSEAQQPAAPTEVGQETKEESRGAAATGIPDPSRTPGMILVEHDGQEPLGTTLVMTEEIITEADPADDDHEETEAIPTTAPLESAPITPQARPQMKRGSQERHEASKANEDTKIEELKATILDLQRQEQEIIQSIRGEGTPTEIIDRHIKDLRRYNEIKDVGQIILGKCAELEGTTIKKQYEIFGLDTED